MKIKDCLACKMTGEEKVMYYLQWRTEVVSGVCRCDYDCCCPSLEFGNDFQKHMDTHETEIEELYLKIIQASHDILREVI